MEQIDLKCWEDFEERISSLFIEKEKLKTLKKPLYVSTPLFRGQANASWELETTLDRVATRDFGVEEYFKALQAVRPAVNSITGKEWDIPIQFDGAERDLSPKAMNSWFTSDTTDFPLHF